MVDFRSPQVVYRHIMHKHTKEFEELKRTVKKLEQTIEKMNDRLQSVEHMSDEFFKSLEELELLIDEIELETGHNGGKPPLT